MQAKSVCGHREINGFILKSKKMSLLEIKGIVGKTYQVGASFRALNEPALMVTQIWLAFTIIPNLPDLTM